MVSVKWNRIETSTKNKIKMYNLENFDKIYDKIVEELRGNLTNKEYRELITLEYVVSQGFDETGDVERYMELNEKR
jgi:hypothetical protein